MVVKAALVLALILVAGCAGHAAPSSSEPGPAATVDPRIPQTAPTPGATANPSQGPESVGPSPTSSAPTTTGAPKSSGPPGSSTPSPAAPKYPVFGPGHNMTLGRAGRETSLAVSPTDDKLMLACARTILGSTNAPVFFLTKDGGATWSDLTLTGPLPLTAGDGDCDVAIDPDGTLYAGYLAKNALNLITSSDNGATWLPADVTGARTGGERIWLQSPAKGTVDWIYQTGTLAGTIAFARSTLGGKVFQPAVTVATTTGAFFEPGYVVEANGGADIWIAYGDVQQDGTERLGIAASHDGGATWTNFPVSTLASPGGHRWIGLSRDAAGVLYIAYSLGKTGALIPYAVVSTDQGQSWSTPVALADNVRAFSVWVAGGASGQAAFAWVGTPYVNGSTAPPDWYVYWARMTQSTSVQHVEYATTTATPLYTGSTPQGPPEYGMLRLGSDGKMRIAFAVPSSLAVYPWRDIYFAQDAGPAT